MRYFTKGRDEDPAATRGRTITVNWPGRACCCGAPPAVRVTLPPTLQRDHAVDLFLCGHHYRGSLDALTTVRAGVSFRRDRVVDPRVEFARALRTR